MDTASSRCLHLFLKCRPSDNTGIWEHSVDLSTSWELAAIILNKSSPMRRVQCANLPGSWREDYRPALHSQLSAQWRAWARVLVRVRNGKMALLSMQWPHSFLLKMRSKESFGLLTHQISSSYPPRRKHVCGVESLAVFYNT